MKDRMNHSITILISSVSHIEQHIILIKFHIEGNTMAMNKFTSYRNQKK